MTDVITMIDRLMREGYSADSAARLASEEEMQIESATQTMSIYDKGGNALSSYQYPECVMKVLRLSVGVKENNHLYDAVLQHTDPENVYHRVMNAKEPCPEAVAWVKERIYN